MLFPPPHEGRWGLICKLTNAWESAEASSSGRHLPAGACCIRARCWVVRVLGVQSEPTKTLPREAHPIVIPLISPNLIFPGPHADARIKGPAFIAMNRLETSQQRS